MVHADPVARPRYGFNPNAPIFAAGLGNGSTYPMVPAICTAKAVTARSAGADPAAAERPARRMSGALIGIAGTIGAAGGVLVNIAFRQSFLHQHNGDAASVGFLVLYALCFLLTWAVYPRPSERTLRNV